MSTRRKRSPGRPGGGGGQSRVISTGIKVEARHRVGQAFPDPVPGKHLWIVAGMWSVNPTAERFELDTENLLNLTCPGCFWCEQEYTPGLACRPCPGEP